MNAKIGQSLTATAHLWCTPQLRAHPPTFGPRHRSSSPLAAAFRPFGEDRSLSVPDARTSVLFRYSTEAPSE